MRRYERIWWWVKQKKKMALVFIIITTILQFKMKGCVGCVETERMGLLQLKSYLESLRSPQEKSILDSWSDDDPKSDCCNWEKIKCSDAIGGHIVDLSLGSLDYYWWPDNHLYLDQSRPFNLSLLHSFPQLRTLDLSYSSFDDLFDPIHGHKSLQRLENLETLNMSSNHFNNNVLSFISAARSLRYLNLGDNRLKGVIPLNGLINLRELEELDLSYNNINDVEAGEGLSKMRLKKLYLSRNKFSDTTRLKGLLFPPSLRVLDFTYNQLSSTQTVLKDMPSLQELDLRGNKLTDLDSLGIVFTPSLRVLDLTDNQLPSTEKGYSNICGLMNLQELGLSNNALTSMPDCLGNLSHLRALDLSDNQLSFTEKGYSKLCGLTNLQELGLSSNALTTMPDCLGNLSRLRTLDLSDNQFAKDLSSFVSGLPSTLEYLSLFDNNFNGLFLFNSLANQTKLKVFQLSSKAGMIQAQAENSWVPLFQLKILKLQNFILGSTIPRFLVHQHELCSIDLSHNELTGAFPAWLVQNNTGLQTILLNNNLLTKLQLPRFVHGLEGLDISSNKINGSIQEDFGIIFPNLRSMKFSSNQFHGTIPSSMGEMKSLNVLDVSSNGLSGQLPKHFLNGCHRLDTLVLSNNQFHGEVFQEHANLTGLSRLFLDGNYLNGSLGKGLLNSNYLFLLDISDNSYFGMLPVWIGRMSNIQYLYMSGNQLKGPFPHQLQSLPLLVLDISHNSFSGMIPRNVTFPYLTELRLQNNEFIGSVPDTLFKSEKLQVLNLRNNNFSGKVLNNIGKRSNLHVLLLGNNSLQSYIPEEICQLSKVSILDLSHNKFKGPIPPCLGNMDFNAIEYKGGPFSSLSEIVWISQCDYHSAIELVFSMEYYSQADPTTKVDFLTKNRNEEYRGGILLYMSGLDLSRNELSGQIPVEIGNLQYIKSLNFSSNRLIGSIPDSVSELKDLESLDLSNNKLDGNIPPALAHLNSLGYFNVSCNNLSGEIPFKGHLGTFNEMSYIGNPHLCGLPTNRSCNHARVPEPSASLQAEEEEDGAIDMEWFYWTCGAVYISTVLALFVFLYIDSRWSREWFYLVDLFIHHLQHYKHSCFSN